MENTDRDREILGIARPDPVLWRYYLLTSLATLPLFPIVATVLWFRYHTMRYRFTDEGVSMSWGILFRHETILNYARIQDIHLRSNVVERWFGIGRVLVQTASGSAGAEMTIEGLRQFEAVRDFLYSRMRGVRSGGRETASAARVEASGAGHELAGVLREVAAEVRALRLALAERGKGGGGGTRHE